MSQRRIYVPRMVSLVIGNESGDRRWVYLSIFGLQPLKRFDHGGWAFLSASWIRRFWRGA